jgi:uncharacterized membrane protein
MKASTAFGAAAVAALATYFFDPEMGRRRRARVRDKTLGKLSHADEAARVAALDLANRSRGLVATLRTRVASRQVPDEIVAERTKAKLGRFSSHPGAIEVSASGGTVTLKGPVLQHEHRRVVRAVRWVPGVRGVIDSLEEHTPADKVFGLQGRRPRAHRADVTQEHWAPATRVVTGGAGAALLACALARRSPMAFALAFAGAAMLLRAGTNQPLARLLGQRGPHIDFTKSVNIAAPVDRVFAFWQNPENFPTFMRNVRSVRRNADGSWHWEVAGPLGATVQWDADMTVCLPNELIAWTTRPGSHVENAGLVHFQAEESGTRVQVDISYNPPGAALGHVVASLFGADPLTEMDEDLMRMKSFLETSKRPHDAAQGQEAPAAPAT